MDLVFSSKFHLMYRKYIYLYSLLENISIQFKVNLQGKTSVQNFLGIMTGHSTVITINNSGKDL